MRQRLSEFEFHIFTFCASHCGWQTLTKKTAMHDVVHFSRNTSTRTDHSTALEMAKTVGIGKINEGVILSNGDSCDNIVQNGFPLSSERYSRSHSDGKQGIGEKHNTNSYCQFIVSHTKSAFGKWRCTNIFFLNLF